MVRCSRRDHKLSLDLDSVGIEITNLETMENKELRHYLLR